MTPNVQESGTRLPTFFFFITFLNANIHLISKQDTFQNIQT